MSSGTVCLQKANQGNNLCVSLSERKRERDGGERGIKEMVCITELRFKLSQTQREGGVKRTRVRKESQRKGTHRQREGEREIGHQNGHD